MVLDQGEDMPYYKALLVLISIAIILQIITGFLALIITNITSFYTRFNDYICYEQMCKHRKAYVEEGTLQIGEIINEGFTDLFAIIKEVDERNQHSAHIDPTYEDSLFKWYNIWEVVMFKCKWTDTSFEEEIIQHETEIAKDEGNADKQKRLNDLKTEYDWRVKRREALSTQGQILKAYVDVVTKERVYKASAKWQRVLNFMMYVIFIINAAIVSLGITKLPGYIPPDPTASLAG